MIAAGAAGVHFEDQLAAVKKCGHMGGKVLVPTQEAVEKLISARFAADVMGTSTIVLARTDAEAANLITSDHDANDKPFLTGERTQEGFYRVKNGLEQAISRGVAYAPYADLVWCETGVPDIGFAREFAQAVHAACPGKLLSYNCSPSFNWKKNLNDSQIASFQEDLSALGYKYQFITLAGIHINWYNTFKRADEIQWSRGINPGDKEFIDYFLPIVADAEAGFGGVLNAFELMKNMIASGAAGVHFEDQLAAVKKCGHMGGKVLVPTQEAVEKLISAHCRTNGCLCE